MFSKPKKDKTSNSSNNQPSNDDLTPPTGSNSDDSKGKNPKEEVGMKDTAVWNPNMQPNDYQEVPGKNSDSDGDDENIRDFMGDGPRRTNYDSDDSD